MATAAEPQVKDWECSICHEPFTIPKLIFCGHVLCRHCLLSWLTSKQEALCPLCRRAIISDQSHPDQSLECVVDSFPTDETMRIWVECEKLLQKDHTCQSCVTQAATSLCLHCHDFLCSSCTAMHGRLSSTRHHAVESLASLTVEQLVANYSSPCQGHPSERSQLYCSTHQESICLLCSSTKHRNCPEVKDLKETASETQEVFSGLVETLSAQETKLNEAIQELDDLIQETDSQMEAALAKVDKTFDGLEASLKRSRQQAKESTVRAFTESRQSAQDCRTHLLQERGALTTHRTVAERGKPMAPSGDLGQMAVAMKKRVSDLVKSPLRPADGKVVKTATAAIRSEAVSSVEKALAELAQDVVKVMPANVVAMASVFQFHPNTGVNIVLSNDHQTAERRGKDSNGGIVVSIQPMKPHLLYEVHLDERGAYNRNYMRVGATTVDPGSMTLPTNAGGWTSAVVFSETNVEDHGVRTYTDVGQKLKNMPKGSRVGVMLDDRQRLHLYINGEHQGEAGTTVSQPCFAFFDVFGSYRKITALLLREV